jgi:cell division protein FtsB
VSIGDMQAKLLQKVEELTLHVIEQNRKLENLKTENETLKKQMAGLQSVKQ